VEDDNYGPTDYGLIRYFGGSGIIRESCEIQLDLTCHLVSLRNLSKYLFFGSLRMLTGFKRLEVKMSTTDKLDLLNGRHSDDFCPPGSEGQKFQEELERGFGPAVCSHDTSHCRLRLRPLKFVRAQNVE